MNVPTAKLLMSGGALVTQSRRQRHDVPIRCRSADEALPSGNPSAPSRGSHIVHCDGTGFVCSSRGLGEAARGAGGPAGEKCGERAGQGYR